MSRVPHLIFFGAAVALKAGEVLKRVVLYLVKMRKATILSLWRMTK